MLALALMLLTSQVRGDVVVAPASLEGWARKSTEVDKFVTAKKAGLLHCYEQRLAVNPKLKGKVAVLFFVLITGRTAEVELQSSFDPELGACITRVVSGWVFPEAEEGVRVSLEFKLKKAR